MHEETHQLARLKTALADRYRVERELGHGGMATVYLAEDLKHHRPVALKVLRPELAAALGSERFLREIEVTARLNHPHILPLLDSGDAGGFVYYTMPYVEGESLRDRLTREKQLPLDDALQIAREVADALSYAHSHDVVHRDIKPENVLLESGHAVVADFGIARAITAAGGERLTETGIAMGTPAYMSPEQAAGSVELDGRSDLYSLGCVLYEMLAGHPPFLGSTAQELLARHSIDAVPSLRAARPLVPQVVEEAVQKALAKTPADRFATAMQLATALEATFRRSPFRRPSVITAAAAVIMVAAGAAAWLLRPHRSTTTLDPNLIAVMPFRATGAPPALQQLAAQIPDILWTKITGEFGPRVTYPPTVTDAWHRAGGTAGGGLPEENELLIAREQGAGLLLHGVIDESGNRLTITASLLDVATNKVRVTPTAVAGQADHWIPLLDTLVTLLLVKNNTEYAAKRVPELARYSPEAIQAYLAGIAAADTGSFRDVRALEARALEADSTFVQAAFLKFDAGEIDTGAARYAWEHRDQLNPRDRAKLRAEWGWRAGLDLTESRVMAQWDSITRMWPEYSTGWWELGEELIEVGGFEGEPDWLERSRDAWRRLIPAKGPVAQYLLQYAAEGAALDRDIEGMRVILHRWGENPKAAGSTMVQYQWRAATLAGDSTAAERAFNSLSQSGGYARIPLFAMADGRGTADADRAAARLPDQLVSQWPIKIIWARVRGHHEEWMRWRDSSESPLQAGMIGAVLRLRDALFLGEQEDSAVRAAARYMTRIASERSPPSTSLDERAIARCWSTLWQVGHGDTAGAPRTIRYLDDVLPSPHHLPVCAGLINVMLHRSMDASLRSAVERLDSIVRQGPLPLYVPGVMNAHTVIRDGTIGLENLVLARLLLRVGDTSAALAAARRRFYGGRPYLGRLLPGSVLPEALREEGRLAAMTGDTAGAINAYNHYLALREHPDYEPWRRERDQVQRELAALVGEPHR